MTSLARWMVVPSAIGSVNGTPTSITCTPRRAASVRSDVSHCLGLSVPPKRMTTANLLGPCFVWPGAWTIRDNCRKKSERPGPAANSHQHHPPAGQEGAGSCHPFPRSPRSGTCTHLPLNSQIGESREHRAPGCNRTPPPVPNAQGTLDRAHNDSLTALRQTQPGSKLAMSWSVKAEEALAENKTGETGRSSRRLACVWHQCPPDTDA